MKSYYAIVLAITPFIAWAGSTKEFEKAETIRAAYWKLPSGEAKKAKYEEAISAYEVAIQADPRDTNAVRGAGEIAFDHADYALATRYYSKLLQLQSTACDAHVRLGLIYLNGGDATKARQELGSEPINCNHGELWSRLKDAVFGGPTQREKLP